MYTEIGMINEETADAIRNALMNANVSKHHVVKIAQTFGWWGVRIHENAMPVLNEMLADKSSVVSKLLRRK